MPFKIGKNPIETIKYIYIYIYILQNILVISEKRGGGSPDKTGQNIFPIQNKLKKKKKTIKILENIHASWG